MTFWKWSRTSASNATADSTCTFPEGMSGAALNDGSRGQMAALAKYRDDQAGAIVTGGSVNAYTVSSFQGFDSLAHLDGSVIAFSPHITSTGACQINVDSLGLKPLRPSPGVDFIAGELIQGTPYTALYNNSTGEAYVRGYLSSPLAVPFLGGLDYWDTIAPNSAFIFPQGQAINRITYAKAFARWGTTYGAGDGSTTFNVPDKKGRVSAMLDAGSSRLSGNGFGGASNVIGLTGGSEKNTLSNVNQLPQFTPSGTITNGAITFPSTAVSSAAGGGAGAIASAPSGAGQNMTAAMNPVQATSSFAGNAIGSASPNSFATCQPTIITNYIIRII